MSDNLIDAQVRFAALLDQAAMRSARRKVVDRARAHVLPRPFLPANDRDPEAA